MDDMKIVLVGYMGSGKTTIGKIVANLLNIKFLDLDDYIERADNSSVAAIFKDKGEVYFRKKEQEYLTDIFLKETDYVLSVGGGTPCFGTNMELINQSTPNSYYINVGIAELTSRLAKEKNDRPLIAHLNENELPEFIGKHLFERSFFYNKAHHKIQGNQRTPAEMAKLIVDSLI